MTMSSNEPDDRLDVRRKLAMLVRQRYQEHLSGSNNISTEIPARVPPELIMACNHVGKLLSQVIRIIGE